MYNVYGGNVEAELPRITLWGAEVTGIPQSGPPF